MVGHNSQRTCSTERAFACSDDPGHPPGPARILPKNQRPGPARISQKLLRPGPDRPGFFGRWPGPARIFKSVPWPGPARTALHSMRPGPKSGPRPGPCPSLRMIGLAFLPVAGRGAPAVLCPACVSVRAVSSSVYSYLCACACCGSWCWYRRYPCWQALSA